MGELDGKKRKPSSNSSGLELLDQVSHGARPVHLILTMVKWFRTSRLSIKNSLSFVPRNTFREETEAVEQLLRPRAPRSGYWLSSSSSSVRLLAVELELLGQVIGSLITYPYIAGCVCRTGGARPLPGVFADCAQALAASLPPFNPSRRAPTPPASSSSIRLLYKATWKR